MISIEKNNQNCYFCDLIQDYNQPSFVAEMQAGILLVNRSQTYKGRCLYIYKKHATDITEIDINDLQQVNLELLAISRVIKETFKADLMNIAALGNEVPHLHWHFIPRYKTESNFNKPPWPHEKIFISEAQQIVLANEIYVKLKEFNYQGYKMEIVNDQRKELCLKKIKA